MYGLHPLDSREEASQSKPLLATSRKFKTLEPRKSEKQNPTMKGYSVKEKEWHRGGGSERCGFTQDASLRKGNN